MKTWAQRRAATRHNLAECASKDEMVALLLAGGYAQDPARPQFIYPATKRQRHQHEKHRQAWGIAAFYHRRNGS